MSDLIKTARLRELSKPTRLSRANESKVVDMVVAGSEIARDHLVRFNPWLESALSAMPTTLDRADLMAMIDRRRPTDQTD